MRSFKLTAVSIIIFALAINLVSCEPDDEIKSTLEYNKTGIAMTGAQETPASTSSGLGTLDVNYNKTTKLLTYKITWQGLADSVTLIRIYGLAPTGYSTTNIIQRIVDASSGIYAQKTSGKYTYKQAGSISNTLSVDGVKVKEEDLVNGLFYINIHTVANPNGEIRAQIRFQ